MQRSRDRQREALSPDESGTKYENDETTFPSISIGSAEESIHCVTAIHDGIAGKKL